MEQSQVLIIVLMNDALVVLNGVLVYTETLSDHLMNNTAYDVTNAIAVALHVAPTTVDLYSYHERQAFIDRHGIEDEWDYDGFVRAVRADLQREV